MPSDIGRETRIQIFKFNLPLLTIMKATAEGKAPKAPKAAKEPKEPKAKQPQQPKEVKVRPFFTSCIMNSLLNFEHNCYRE